LPRPAQSRLLVALLLVALGLRALVPEGFMPAPGHLVELCTEHGLQRMLVDAQTGEVLGSEDDAAATTCPWSLLLTTLAVPTLPPAAQAPAVTRETPPGRALPPSTTSGTPTPPVRAPPRLA
jgi:hypothetical protein